MFDEIRETLQGWLAWFRRLPVVIKAVLGLLFLCSLCSYSCDFYARILTRNALGTNLPAEAKGLRASYSWGMQGNDSTHVSFRITPEQLDAFIAQSCIEPLIEGYNPFVYPYDLARFQQAPIPLATVDNRRSTFDTFVFGKWEPKTLTQYAGIEGFCENSNLPFDPYYSIVADTSNPNLYWVYLQMIVTDKP